MPTLVYGKHPRRPQLVPLLLLAVALALFLSPAEASATSLHRCRDVVIRNYDGSIYTQTRGLAAKHTGCPLARRVARRYLANDGIPEDTVRGFTCKNHGGVRVTCEAGRRRIIWHF